jgi:uncharacterized protein YjbI with pentapeptide repeats
MAKLRNTAFQNVQFKVCKMLGMHFEVCSKFLFEVNFEGCLLNLSSFYQMLLKKSSFKDCSLLEVDFVEAVLTGSSFEGCNLAGAMFEHTQMEKCDFRSAINYSIDPDNNQIKKARFSASGLPGLLNKYNLDIE